ncbi:MAG TPA: hypothetical protein VFJ94_15835 [Intrasporangium sp.]|uniref:hypothetical protein n=1 Tax=Intrasporangium sp. TaxID=1925024 RepID=UPI002D794C4D|nr:hypothetical protein [Intrasporangium sp.]HET7399986.1 hypothetical protein [Intrasporangium sp.]
MTSRPGDPASVSVLGGALRGHALRLARLLDELERPSRRGRAPGRPDPTAPERALLARTAEELDRVGAQLQGFATTTVETAARLRRLEQDCAAADLRVQGEHVVEPAGPSRTDPADRLRSRACLQAHLSRVVTADAEALADLQREVHASAARLERLSERARTGSAAEAPGW